VRVVIAEDLALLRDGLTRILDAFGCQVVEAVADGPSVLPALVRHRPDVAVVDVRLPPTFTDEGLQAALQARTRLPGLPILVLSQHVEQLYARELLSDRGGGVGYLLKDRVSNVDQFVDAVRRVAAGGMVMDPEVVSQLLARNAAAQPLRELTAREREVLGRGPVERGDRRPAVRHREGGQQAHQQHLQQAGHAPVRRRQPPGARRPRLSARVSGSWRARGSARPTPSSVPSRAGGVGVPALVPSAGERSAIRRPAPTRSPGRSVRLPCPGRPAAASSR
jgi:DNA-binding NarL/FixJ family response regulator